MIFSALTFAVAIPSAIKVFNWLATMYKGSIWLATPMCYAMVFLFLFAIGGLTGLFLGALSVNVSVHGTYFVVAHFHYVMVGGNMIAFVAGLHYWWPKITGRMYSEFWGRISALLVLAGFNLTFFPQFILGTRGMPRRYYDYTKLLADHPEFTYLNRLSTLGAFLLAAGLVLVAVYLAHSLFYGRPAPANPWGAATLEWQCSSPPPHDNFSVQPTVGDPYVFDDLVYDPADGGYVRKMTMNDVNPSEFQSHAGQQQFPGPSLPLPAAAIRRRQARHVDLPAHRDPAFRRPVLRLCRLSRQPPGNLHLRPPVLGQDPRRHQHVRADPQQPDHGLGRSLRPAQPGPRADRLPAANALVRLHVPGHQVRRVSPQVAGRAPLGVQVRSQGETSPRSRRRPAACAPRRKPPPAKQSSPSTWASSSASISP